MKRLLNISVLVSLLLLVSGPLLGEMAQDAKQQKTPPPEKPRTVADTLAQLSESWGKPVNGAKAGLFAPVYLRFGQPLQASLSALPPSQAGPYVHIQFGDDGTTKLHMTDDQGRVVPFHFDLGANGGSLDGAFANFRLRPTDTHARGRYWKPGVYHLQVIIEAERNIFEPNQWYGKLITNSVRLEVVEADKMLPSLLSDPDRRKEVSEWIKDLDSDTPANREAAEKGLKACWVDILPIIEEALPRASPKAAALLKEIQGNVAAFFFVNPAFDTGMGSILASLDENTWISLRKLLGEHEMANRVARAQYGPVLPLSEKQLVEMLDHKDTDVRIQAIRGLPKTNNKAVLEKLILCLADPYVEWRGFPHQIAIHPVSAQASAAIVWQGKSIVPLLLNFGGDKDEKQKWANYRPAIAHILGKIGPEKESERFLREMIRDKDDNARFCAVQALVDWGSAGAPALMEVAKNEKEGASNRSKALEHVSRYAKAEELGPTLRKMLKPDGFDQLAWTIVECIQRISYREALPDVVTLALSEKIDQNVRYKSIDAVVALAPKAEAEKVLLALLGSGTHDPVRQYAMIKAAKGGFRAAVPKLLDILDSDSWLRDTADRGLRVLADLPDGVGYDPANPNSAAWRKWWEFKK